MVTTHKPQIGRNPSPQMSHSISKQLAQAIVTKDGTRIRNILSALQRIDSRLAAAMVLRAKCRKGGSCLFSF